MDWWWDRHISCIDCFIHYWHVSKTHEGRQLCMNGGGMTGVCVWLGRRGVVEGVQ